ncbi:DUF4858 domain-containing protein [uncultured Bacteroides sp.]|uniref:DUF4858 domain-containing protein n=1 Tax=uncultured Bacteroides sp. TaxID=162156 RepID=UPI0025EA68B5|nr:DUF4858 domain-containing protein [uncultured Bacteroides sp.]
MSGLIKRFFASVSLCFTTLLAYSQVWTAQDSLHLKKLLESDRELHLNMDAVKSIDFGGTMGTPRMVEEKKWMLPDESLPEVLPKSKATLSLRPYKTNTRFDWDPVYQKKIRVDKDTWRRDSFYQMRARGTSGNGAAIGGLDLMLVFTKDFWNRRGRYNRARTLNILHTYGDSTTVLLNQPVEQIVH